MLIELTEVCLCAAELEHNSLNRCDHRPDLPHTDGLETALAFSGSHRGPRARLHWRSHYHHGLLPVLNRHDLQVLDWTNPCFPYDYVGFRVLECIVLCNFDILYLHPYHQTTVILTRFHLCHVAIDPYLEDLDDEHQGRDRKARGA